MQVKPTGPSPARIMIVGEFPSEADVQSGVPLSGTTGNEFGRMLTEAGIMRQMCFVTTVLRTRPFANKLDGLIALKKNQITAEHVMLKDKFVLPQVAEAVALLKREIELCQPNVIIALGDLALWALTGEWGITSWRGSMMSTDLDVAMDWKPTVVPAYAPYMVMRQWSWRPIVVHDLKRARTLAGQRGITPPDYVFITRPDFGTVVTVLNQLIDQLATGPKKLSCDVETRAGHIACIGIGWSKREAMCIPLMCKERPAGYWSEQEELTLYHLLRQLLTHPNCEVIGQNFHYDAQYFYRHFRYVPNLTRDTLLAQHTIFSNMQKSLDFLSSMYCEFHTYWKDEGKDWDPSMDEDSYWRYNCKDCVITFEVDEEEQKIVDAMGLRAVHDFQQALFWPVLETMITGIRVDTSRRQEFSLELLSAIMERENWLIEILGHPINPKSPPQMQKFFYEDLALKPVINRKTGAPSCDDEALRKLVEREPLIRQVVNKILEIRSLGVFNSTFVSAPLDVDSRTRCSFNIGGTETYRFSSSKNAFGSGLNLQNIPKGGDMGDDLTLPNVRSLFIPDPGMTFFDIDLASADLRIVVWEADEPEMKAMLKEGYDPYTEIAKEFYHDPTITKKDPRRQTFKSFAHGTNYLGTAKGLAERLGLPVHQAEQTQAWYFSRFPKIKKWQDNLKDQVVKRRMVQNVFGYRCYFFDRIEGTIFNQAAAWIPQSTVACIINRAYVNIYRTLPEVQVLLQVHDSLAGQFPTALGDVMVDKIVKAAEIALPYVGDPLVIPVGVKTSNVSWGGCE